MSSVCLSCFIYLFRDCYSIVPLLFIFRFDRSIAQFLLEWRRSSFVSLTILLVFSLFLFWFTLPFVSLLAKVPLNTLIV